jgi:hypothetical protein
MINSLVFAVFESKRNDDSSLRSEVKEGDWLEKGRWELTQEGSKKGSKRKERVKGTSRERMRGMEEAKRMKDK